MIPGQGRRFHTLQIRVHMPQLKIPHAANENTQVTLQHNLRLWGNKKNDYQSNSGEFRLNAQKSHSVLINIKQELAAMVDFVILPSEGGVRPLECHHTC